MFKRYIEKIGRMSVGARVDHLDEKDRWGSTLGQRPPMRIIRMVVSLEQPILNRICFRAGKILRGGEFLF